MRTTWDLSTLFKDDAAYEKAFSHFKDVTIGKLASYEGTLSDENKLAEYLAAEKAMNEELGRLYHYASGSSDLDKKDVKLSARYQTLIIALNELSEKTSFEAPEILALGKEKAEAFFEHHPELSEFDFQFKKLFRSQEHVLSKDKEKLLAAYNPLLDKGSSLYSSLSVADYVPKKAKLTDGSEVEVQTSNWTSLVANAKCEEDRKIIFETLYSYFDEHKTTYADIYNVCLAGEKAETTARGYKSILESHLYDNAIPTEVFHSLIETASENAAPLHKYYEIRRKYLGLDHHRSYDRFIQLAHSDKKYSFDDAKNLFFSSISSFPEDFQAKAHEVLKDGYIDVYSKPGKRSGAYSSGGEGIHPFILLNFNGELDDCFTLAHESGHSIHTLYAMESEPIMKQGYTIFVAEIASTFNEHNLLDYLIDSGKLTKDEEIMLLQKAIDDICSTFYRQTLFGQYEYDISLKAEKGEAITYETLSEEMRSLYQTYYGIDIAEEKVKPLVWAYIPHLFYTPFYVYQYATSFTASMLIYENVKNKVPGAFENYIKLLRSGGSDFPVEQVKLAGVDLTKKESFLAVTRRMSELVDKLAALLGE